MAGNLFSPALSIYYYLFKYEISNVKSKRDISQMSWFSDNCVCLDILNWTRGSSGFNIISRHEKGKLTDNKYNAILSYSGRCTISSTVGYAKIADARLPLLQGQNTTPIHYLWLLFWLVADPSYTTGASAAILASTATEFFKSRHIYDFLQSRYYFARLEKMLPFILKSPSLTICPCPENYNYKTKYQLSHKNTLLQLSQI